MASAASVYSLVQEDRTRAESAAWAQFASPGSANEFNTSWLGILCAQVEHVRGALLLLRADGDGGFVAAAVWPDASRSMHYLAPTAEKTLRERVGVVVASDGTAVAGPGQPAHVGHPIEVGGVLYGAVVLHLASASEAELQRALRLVHWGTAWLVDHFRQQQQAEQQVRLQRLTLVTDLVASAVNEASLKEAAVAVVNTLAGRLQCDRVSLGLDIDGEIEVRAISHTATFDSRSNLVRLLGEAMDEVLDLDLAMVYPPGDGDELGVLAHAELAHDARDIAICSVPLLDQGQALGVLTLERSAGEVFDAATVEVCKAIGLALGPVLALKLDAQQGVWARLQTQGRNAALALFGPRHPGVKLLTLVVAAVLVFLSVAKGDYRVAAKTLVEGAIQRAAVAPFGGFVMESRARAGDVVKKDQLLARIDDKDLLLEQTRWSAERAQLMGKHRQAFAAQDRANMQVVSAQLHQTQAQLSLVESKLQRAELRAPFDGVVVSGDLSQLLGTPVEQGKVLFEIAPLDDYRVILQVDERDIADLRTGQRGELALSGLPHQTLPFSVKQITPVTNAKDGLNYFRVEAHVEQASDRLRPGMEGVGKVSVGERRLIWIWSHSMVDWLRLTIWRWMP